MHYTFSISIRYENVNIEVIITLIQPNALQTIFGAKCQTGGEGIRNDVLSKNKEHVIKEIFQNYFLLIIINFEDNT